LCIGAADDSPSSEDIEAGLLDADALYQAGSDEGPEKVEGTLLGDGQRIPDFAGG
jgi:hypothetical protein